MNIQNSYSPSAMIEASRLLADADRICVLSGAGLSKASGIPTYRDAGGLWRTEDNLKYSHADGYRADPDGFRRFWNERMKSMGSAKPNPAHAALAQLQAAKPHVSMVTQNVDGLLQAAGCSNVLELHGNLTRMRCTGCGRENPLSLGWRCLRCFSRTRPDVVLFGESLSEDTVNEAREHARKSQVFLVVGTTALVYPAADLPVLALRSGAKLIVMDVERPLLAAASDIYLEGRAELLLPELVDRALQAS